jgi:hypothetical protein
MTERKRERERRKERYGRETEELKEQGWSEDKDGRRCRNCETVLCTGTHLHGLRVRTAWALLVDVPGSIPALCWHAANRCWHAIQAFNLLSALNSHWPLASTAKPRYECRCFLCKLVHTSYECRCFLCKLIHTSSASRSCRRRFPCLPILNNTGAVTAKFLCGEWQRRLLATGLGVWYRAKPFKHINVLCGHKNAVFRGNFTAVTMTNIFSDITPCVSNKNRRFREHVAAVLRMIRLSIFLARSEDIPEDGRGRDPLATAPSQLCISATMESLLMGRCFVDYFLISLDYPKKTFGILKCY